MEMNLIVESIVHFRLIKSLHRKENRRILIEERHDARDGL